MREWISEEMDWFCWESNVEDKSKRLVYGPDQ
jgi:hypothetical protein